MRDVRSERVFGLGNPAESAANDASAGIKISYDPGIRISFDGCFVACNGGPCDQGRKLCPSPEACRLAEEDLPVPMATWRPIVYFLIAFWGVAALAAWAAFS